MWLMLKLWMSWRAGFHFIFHLIYFEFLSYILFIFWPRWETCGVPGSPARDRTCASCVGSTVFTTGQPGKSLFWIFKIILPLALPFCLAYNRTRMLLRDFLTWLAFHGLSGWKVVWFDFALGIFVSLWGIRGILLILVGSMFSVALGGAPLPASSPLCLLPGLFDATPSHSLELIPWP